MMKSVATALLALTVALAEEPSDFRVTFDDFDPARFLTQIPNEYTEVRDGVLWTRGGAEKGYPPMVFLPIQGTDLTISFRYRQLGEGKYVWFLIDGDDGFGGRDHLFRVKLLRNGIQLQVDGHTLDADDPDIQKFGGPRIDKVSGSYRTNEVSPLQEIDLSGNDWHHVEVAFRGESVRVTLDETKWSTALSRPGFKVPKSKLLWLLKGGEAGIELDDICVQPAVATAIKPDDPR